MPKRNTKRQELWIKPDLESPDAITRQLLDFQFPSSTKKSKN